MPAPDSPVEPAPDQPVVTLPGSNGSAPDAPASDEPASDERASGGSVIPLEPLAEAVVPTPSSAEVAHPVPALDAPGTVVDRLDDVVDGWFDRMRGQKAVDRLMYTTTELADFSLLWHLIGAARGATARDVDRGFVETARLASVLGAESLLVNGVLKGMFKRQRPVPEFERPLHLRVPLTSSFPSGHASAAFCSAAILSQTSRGGRLWYGVAALVASSRVYVKIHHPSDVLAGAAVGLTMGMAARRLWPLGRR
jgi:undecaprenyl-diphosphatase